MSALSSVNTELEADWKNALSVWWLLFWRGRVIFIGGASLVAFVIGSVGWFFGMSQERIWIFSGVVDIAWSIPAFIWITRSALRKRYKGFRIALIATKD